MACGLSFVTAFSRRSAANHSARSWKLGACQVLQSRLHPTREPLGWRVDLPRLLCTPRSLQNRRDFMALRPAGSSAPPSTRMRAWANIQVRLVRMDCEADKPVLAEPVRYHRESWPAGPNGGKTKVAHPCLSAEDIVAHLRGNQGHRLHLDRRKGMRARKNVCPEGFKLARWREVTKRPVSEATPPV